MAGRPTLDLRELCFVHEAPNVHRSTTSCTAKRQRPRLGWRAFKVLGPTIVKDQPGLFTGGPDMLCRLE